MGGGGSTYDYGFRIYNPQIGKFLSVDPLSHKFAFYTPYQFAGNKPIVALDLDGREDIWVHEVVNLDTKIRTTTTKEVDEDVKKEIIAFLGYLPDETGGGVLMTSAKTENGETYRVSDYYIEPIVVTGKSSEGDGAIMETLKSWDNLEGEQGLKKYSNGLNNTGNALTAASVFTGPASPVVAGLGKGLGIASDVINSGLDFKNKDLSTAIKNSGIRVGVFLGGELINKQLDKLDSSLPLHLQEVTKTEKAIGAGIDLILDAIKDNLTDDDKKQELEK